MYFRKHTGGESQKAEMFDIKPRVYRIYIILWLNPKIYKSSSAFSEWLLLCFNPGFLKSTGWEKQLPTLVTMICINGTTSTKLPPGVWSRFFLCMFILLFVVRHVLSLSFWFSLVSLQQTYIDNVQIDSCEDVES